MDTTGYSQTTVDVAVAIGVDPHEAIAPISGSALFQIIIMADADVGKSHQSAAPRCSFVFSGVEHGHFVASPPLYRIDVAQGKRPARKLYALDDTELEVTEDRLTKEGVKPGSWSVGRFKGLGEMNPEQLWETTMNPETRRVVAVRVARGQAAYAMQVFAKLMGKTEAASRREWMEQNGNAVEVDI